MSRPRSRVPHRLKAWCWQRAGAAAASRSSALPASGPSRSSYALVQSQGSGPATARTGQTGASLALATVRVGQPPARSCDATALARLAPCHRPVARNCGIVGESSDAAMLDKECNSSAWGGNWPPRPATDQRDIPSEPQVQNPEPLAALPTAETVSAETLSGDAPGFEAWVRHLSEATHPSQRKR